VSTSPAGGDDFLEKLAIALLGALLTILSQIIIKRASQRADTFKERIEAFCHDVRQLADAAGGYWAAAPDDKDLPKLEAKVFALHSRMMSNAGLLGEEKDDFRTMATDLLR
jgi:hypothetical protein